MKILVISAHPDDEVYGVGGTTARLTDEKHEVHVQIITEGCTAQYKDTNMIMEKRREADRMKTFLGTKDYLFGDFPDMMLDKVPQTQINASISGHLSRLKPEWIFTHSPTDLNKDHQIVFNATMVASRHYPCIKRILSYEVPSSTELGESPFNPNMFVDITEQMGRKLKAVKAYKSELREYPHGRSPEAVTALAQFRGYSSGFPYAEAFRIVRERL